MEESEFQKHYKAEVATKLQKKFKFKNKHNIPKLKKIIISMGLAEASNDKQILEYCIEDLKKLSGQKPIVTKAKGSISNFKLREDQPIGAVVTLRRKKMYDFMYKLIHISTPRIPDFRGLKTKCDGKGNYSMGLKDQTVFPEVNLDKMKKSQGMNITFVTTATSDEECLELLELMGMPLKKNK
ncbi:MAG: 50S ribosomal protein L5 [Chlamydiia bacterium]|nr:50S ribosomal protein L5 [Chlamydiia bacterium]